jgi:hypothetical protein
MDAQDIQAAYTKAESKVTKPLKCSRVFYGVYLASDRNGRLWEVSQQIESPGKPWLAQSYPVSHHSDYTDHMPTKFDVLYSLGFQ